MIHYSRQKIDKRDLNEVTKALKKDFITTGPTVLNFEKALSRVVKSKFAVATNSATSALHIACLSMGLKKDDWVWTSPNSFVSTSNCALYCGAKIDFVDIDPRTFNLSIRMMKDKLKKTKKKNLPKILIPVSFAGQSCEMKEIYRLSKIYNFMILEDSSHALGAKYNNNFVGCGKYADISVFSFHPVKMITTGEGGVAVTNNKKFYKKMLLYRSHGMERINSNIKPHFYKVKVLGFNFRMTDFQAALGLSQLKKLKYFLSARKRIFSYYNKNLKNLPIDLPFILSENQSSHHLYVIKLKGKNVFKKRNDLVRYLKKFKINTNIHYIPIYLHAFYKQNGFKNKVLKNCEDYYKRALSIPIHQKIKNTELKLIVNKISNFFNKKI